MTSLRRQIRIQNSGLPLRLGAESGPAEDPPINLVAPVIYGSRMATAPHIVNTNSWSNIESLELQWLLNGVEISGAEHRQLIAGTSAIGGILECDVTGVGPTGLRTTVRTAPFALTGYKTSQRLTEVPGPTPSLVGIYNSVMGIFRQITNTSVTVSIDLTTGKARSNSTTSTFFIWPSMNASTNPTSQGLTSVQTTGWNNPDYKVWSRITWHTDNRESAAGAACRATTAGAGLTQTNAGNIAAYHMEWLGSPDFRWELRRRDSAAGLAWVSTTVDYQHPTLSAALPVSSLNVERVTRVWAEGSGNPIRVYAEVYDASGTLLLRLRGDDSTAGRLTTIGVPGWWFRNSNTSLADMEIEYPGNTGISSANDSVILLKSNGCKTLFNFENFIRDGDRSYVSSVATDLKPTTTIIDKGVIINLTFPDNASSGLNDHCDATYFKLPNGKLAIWGSPHGGIDGFYFLSRDTRNFRMLARIQYHISNPGGTSLSLDANMAGYARPWVTKDRVWNLARLGTPNADPPNESQDQALHSWPVATIDSRSGVTQVPVKMFTNPGARPYAVTGIERGGPNDGDCHVLMSDDLPGEGSAGLRYVRIAPKVDGTVDLYNIAGTLITDARPINIKSRVDCRILDTTTVEQGGQNWPNCVFPASDGTIYMTSMRYPPLTPQSEGWVLGENTADMQHWTHIKRPGETTFTSRKFSGGMPQLDLIKSRTTAIDGNDPTLIWACEFNALVGVSGRYVVRLYRYNWATGGRILLKEWADPNMHYGRLTSARGHDGIIACVFFGSNTHNRFNDWGSDTSMYAVSYPNLFPAV